MKPWTGREVLRAISLRKGGSTIAEIATELSRHPSSVGKALRRAGVGPEHNPGRRLADVERRFRRLVAAGKTRGEIAKALGVSKTRPALWARKLGLEIRAVTREEFDRMVRDSRAEVRRRRAEQGLPVGPGEFRALRLRQEAAEMGWPEADSPGRANALQALFDAPDGLTAEELAAAAGMALRSFRNHALPLFRAMGYVFPAGRRGHRIVWQMSAWMRARKEAS